MNNTTETTLIRVPVKNLVLSPLNVRNSSCIVYFCFGIFFILLSNVTSIPYHSWKTIFRGNLSRVNPGISCTLNRIISMGYPRSIERNGPPGRRAWRRNIDQFLVDKFAEAQFRQFSAKT